MVQAAAQAQAVVAAARVRNGGATAPLSRGMISALARAQAEAIVKARAASDATAGTSAGGDADADGATGSSEAEMVEMQTQALVHAHTQAQIAAGTLKPDYPTTAGEAAAEVPPRPALPAVMMHSAPAASAPVSVALSLPQSAPPAVAPPAPQPNGNTTGAGSTSASAADPAEFRGRVTGLLQEFWGRQTAEMERLPIGVEQDFKNHNDLPLARIKRIMKSDEDVRMISAEAPVLFAKAVEMFVLELTLRSWCYSEQNRRRTLQKDDLQTAIKKTDIFDFLVDVIM